MNKMYSCFSSTGILSIPDDHISGFGTHQPYFVIGVSTLNICILDFHIIRLVYPDSMLIILRGYGVQLDGICIVDYDPGISTVLPHIRTTVLCLEIFQLRTAHRELVGISTITGVYDGAYTIAAPEYILDFRCC